LINEIKNWDVNEEDKTWFFLTYLDVLELEMLCHKNKVDHFPIIKDLWYFLDGFDMRVKTGTDFSFREKNSKENENWKEKMLELNKKTWEMMGKEKFLKLMKEKKN